MGSVIDYIECPNCGQEAYSDFYYKTGEEYVNCQECGYHYSATILNRDKRLYSELTDDDWEIKECKEPYGAYRIKHYDSVAYECGTLVTEMDYWKMKEYAEGEPNVEYFSVSRLVEHRIVKEIVVDNGPKTDSAGFSEEDREGVASTDNV